jgi:hypothetical protein
MDVILLRVWFRGNVSTESLPNNGYTHHSIIHNLTSTWTNVTSMQAVVSSPLIYKVKILLSDLICLRVMPANISLQCLEMIQMEASSIRNEIPGTDCRVM